MLTIRLEENECFSAWVIGCRTNAKDVTPDLKSECLCVHVSLAGFI